MRVTAVAAAAVARALPTAPKRGFVFDLDGVLQRGSAPLPRAHEALLNLYDAHRGAWAVPTAFLTNGGGCTEVERARVLTDRLGVPIAESQVVLAHSPLRCLRRFVSSDDVTALTVGGPACADALRAYGYAHAIDTSELARLDPSAVPFSSPAPVNRSSSGSGRDRGAQSSDSGSISTDSSSGSIATGGEDDIHPLSLQAAGKKVALVAVMADSRDWGRDIQLIHDALAANPRARVALCNSDKFFPTPHGQPRLAGGLFGVALRAVHAAAMESKSGGQSGEIGSSDSDSEAHAGPLGRGKVIRLGKPYGANFGAAERALRASLTDCIGDDQQACSARGSGQGPLPGRIWMVGDNIASDIMGATRRGGPWRALLVRTGNYKDGDSGGDLASAILDDVADAVEYGLAHE